MEDLLQHFTDPSIMDIKIGTRTFLESEVKNPVVRKDLYEKMIKLSPDEPTAEEHEQKAITKLRYMQFREKNSSTTTLGFRIEAMKLAGETLNTDLKKVKSKDQIRQAFAKYLQGNTTVLQKLVARLEHLRDVFETSPYFKKHEIIGSSILIMFDSHCKCNAWMIDFAKTLQFADHTLDHRTPWTVGNHEDGYLVGIDNMIEILSNLDLDKYDANGPIEVSSEKGLRETCQSEKDNRKHAEKQQENLICRSSAKGSTEDQQSNSVIHDVNLTESECNNKSKPW